jgi:endonuclease YncB( thermonuclease family)
VPATSPSLSSRFTLPLLAAALLLSSPAQAGRLKTALALMGVGAGATVATVATQAAKPPPVANHAVTLVGRAVHIEDGDTMILLTADKVQHRIRLVSIDAPETRHGAKRPAQPFSQASKQGLSDLLAGNEIAASCPGQDRYGRNLCELQAGGVNVNYELVRRGLAWANTSHPGYIRDPRVLGAQKEAQAARRGLWEQSRPVPPWEWRKVCWEQGRCTGQDP